MCSLCHRWPRQRVVSRRRRLFPKAVLSIPSFPLESHRLSLHYLHYLHYIVYRGEAYTHTHTSIDDLQRGGTCIYLTVGSNSGVYILLLGRDMGHFPLGSMALSSARPFFNLQHASTFLYFYISTFLTFLHIYAGDVGDARKSRKGKKTEGHLMISYYLMISCYLMISALSDDICTI